MQITKFKYNKTDNYNQKMDNKYKILLYLARNKETSILKVAKILDIPYTTTLRTVNELKELLKIEKIGPTKVVKLDRDNEINKAYLAIASEEEKKEFLKNNNTVKLIERELNVDDIVLLFGSYAKKEETEKSDVDLMVINEKGNRTIDFSRQERLLSKKINPLFFTKKEFKRMLEENEENVGKQALKHNVVLNKPLEFWKLVLNERR